MENSGKHLGVSVTLPVYNEEPVLEWSVRILSGELSAALSVPWKIVIVDNGSTDGTRGVAEKLASQWSKVSLEVVGQKGRGRAIRQAWENSGADIVSYMDVDLSTDLKDYSELIAPLRDGTADIAIGSRLAKGASVERGLKREILSRVYNRLVWLMFGNRFVDAQCGFKAMRKEAAEALLPEIKDNEWFFDTELLLKAEASGYRIAEVPVRWRDDPDSRVRIMSTAWKDVKGLFRVKRELWSNGGKTAQNSQRGTFEEESADGGTWIEGGEILTADKADGMDDEESPISALNRSGSYCMADEESDDRRDE